MTNNLPNGLEIFESNGSVRCCDCGRWEHQPDQIKHSNRCDTPNLQFDTKPETAETETADYRGLSVTDCVNLDLREGRPIHEAQWGIAMNSDTD